MKSTIGKCKTCKWFVKDNTFSTTGECFYAPPIVLIDKHATYRSEHPVAMESWFCSKWQSNREI